jgi:hypothetical protein
MFGARLDLNDGILISLESLIGRSVYHVVDVSEYIVITYICVRINSRADRPKTRSGRPMDVEGV